MRVVVGAVAAVLIGLALATGVTVAVSSSSAPDKGVNLENPDAPNNAVGGGGGASNGSVDYGTP